MRANFFVWGEKMNQGQIKFKEKNYPKSPGKYVISTSLWHSIYGSDFAKIMNDYLGGIPTTKSAKENYKIDTKILSIESALQFLDNVSKNEAQKEQDFITWFSQTTGELPPSSAEDWRNFIRKFQVLLNNGQKDLVILQNELARIKKNKDAIKKHGINKEGKKYTAIIRSELSQWEYVGKRLESVASFLSGNNSKIGEMIVSLILNKYGDNLLSFKQSGENIKVELNSAETAAAILGISQLVLDQFYTTKLNKFYTEESNNFSNTITQKELEEIINNSTELDNNIKKLITNMKELPLLSNDIISNYQISGMSTEIRLNSTLSNSMNIIQQLRLKTLSEIKNSLDFKTTISFVEKSANAAELIVPIKEAALGAITAKNLGKYGGKADNIIGWLKIEPNINNNEIKKHIISIQQRIQQLSDSMNQDNTEEYYNKRQQDWKNTIESINKELIEINETYNTLAECFIIEESTKGYTNIGVDNKTSFHGGSLGANIESQINKISALQNHGLITTQDADWLMTAAINVGEGLILHSQKNKLQDYLSTFAVILLFDDQRGIANEVAEKIINNIPSSSNSTKIIHLFTLNNGVYPLSYVLRLTYNKLVKIFGLITELEDGPAEYGAKVNITGFINPDNKYGPGKWNKMTLQSWSEISQEALKSVHMEIDFVTNFVSLLNEILQQ